MNRPVAFVLGAISLAGLARSAFAQEGYPYPPMGYPQAMPAMSMPYMPAYGAYGQPIMPVNARGMPMQMPVPVMAVPVPVVITQAIPMFGALETMPAGGPLDASAMEYVDSRQAGAPAPVVEPAGTPTTVQTKATVAAAKPVAPAPVKVDVATPAVSPEKKAESKSMFRKFAGWINRL